MGPPTLSPAMIWPRWLRSPTGNTAVPALQLLGTEAVPQLLDLLHLCPDALRIGHRLGGGFVVTGLAEVFLQLGIGIAGQDDDPVSAAVQGHMLADKGHPRQHRAGRAHHVDVDQFLLLRDGQVADPVAAGGDVQHIGVYQVAQIEFGPHHVPDQGKFQGKGVFGRIFILDHISTLPQGIDHAESGALRDPAQLCDIVEAHGAPLRTMVSTTSNILSAD